MTHYNEAPTINQISKQWGVKDGGAASESLINNNEEDMNIHFHGQMEAFYDSDPFSDLISKC